MRVVALSGPNGAGKSTLLERVSGSYPVVSANYRTLDRHKLDNGDVLSKWLYVGTWFDQLFELQANGVSLLVVDRSPLDTAAYAVDGETLLLPAILRSFSEIRRRNVEITSVLITASSDTLSERLLGRLAAQPERLQYSNVDYSVSERARLFYKSHPELWDNTIDTTNLSEEQALVILTEVLETYAKL